MPASPYAVFRAVRDHSQARGAARTILFVLATYADRSGGGIYPSYDTIEKGAFCTRDTVAKSLQRLVELGEIEKVRQRPSGTWEYRITLLLDSSATELLDSSATEPSEFNPHGRAVQFAPPDSSATEPDLPELPVGTTHEQDRVRVPSDLQEITDDEHALAAAVVVAFNSSADTALSVDAHLTPIAARIREHPGLTFNDHRAAIEAVFAGEHWWSGPPSPRIIYGKANLFEQALEAAKAEKRKPPKFDVNAEAARIRREQGLD
jgi:hypothetical protein